MRLLQSWEVKKSYEKQYQQIIKMFGRAIIQNVKDLQDINNIQNTLRDMKFNEEYVLQSVVEIMTRVRKNSDREWLPYIKTSKEIYSGIINQITKSQLNAVMDNIIRQNVDMINKLPQSVSNNISDYIKRETLKGVRATDMIEGIKQRIPNITDNSATLIAKTQVSMTQSALTETRSKSLGLNWYRWRSSEDERVRSSHSNLEGVLISWDNPPSPESLIGQKSIGDYHAGNTFRCRCYAEPVINPERLPNIVRVYMNGQIITMGKRQFIEIM